MARPAKAFRIDPDVQEIANRWPYGDFTANVNDAIRQQWGNNSSNPELTGATAHKEPPATVIELTEAPPGSNFIERPQGTNDKGSKQNAQTAPMEATSPPQPLRASATLMKPSGKPVDYTGFRKTSKSSGNLLSETDSFTTPGLKRFLVKPRTTRP